VAETKKEEGNKLYKQKKYHEALKQYSSAIESCPNIPSYYGNRSACLMMICKYKEALDDIQKATKLDPSFTKGYLREAKCHLLFGDTTSAGRCLQTVKTLDPSNTALIQDKKTLELLEKHVNESKRYFDKSDYRSALYNIKNAISVATQCTAFKLIKAECLVMMSKHSEAQEIVNDILRFDGMNADALYIRGMTLYYTDNVDKAFSHFQQVLVFNPDHEKAKQIYRKAKQLVSQKQEGNNAIKQNKIDDALRIYTNALTIDPLNSLTNAKLYFNRSIVYAKLKKLAEAINDCSKAIELDESYIKAYLRRGKLSMDSELYEEAVRDYETVLKKEKTREHKQLLDTAKLELKKSKRKDYYKILGVSKTATDDELKKAYKVQALKHHPDRHTTDTDDEKKEAERKFKEVGEAYAVLTDPKKRSRYDNGHDLDGGGMDGFDIDPNNLFQAFWSTGGAPSGFSSSQGPFHYTFSQGGNHSGAGQHGFSFNNFPF
ncbi:unnamed protein product, partial [Medioppia subpectinata]